MIAPARRAAYDVLMAVDSRRADLPAAIARARETLRDERDRALAAEIATGTLRWLGALDHLLGSFGRRAPERLDVEVLTILRLSAYQLLHLDRVPAPAVVHDAVELTRAVRRSGASSYVNAVLRSIQRNAAHLPLPPRPTDGADERAALDFLSITTSHPRWLASRWLRRYGFDAAVDWTSFNLQAAPLTLRVNTLKVDRETLIDRLTEHGVIVERAAHAPHGLLVVSGNPLRTPLAGTGELVLQDEASQLVTLLVNARPGTSILDTCAAPGGKTTAMAAAMRDRGLLVATDVRGARLDLLRHAVAAAGATCIRIAQNDLAAGLSFTPVFDAVLVDAPCSGLGTVRRDPDVKWRRTEAELGDMARLQTRMLDVAGEAVKPGGRLVYATCSSEPEENEQVVAAFLARHPQFRPVPRDVLIAESPALERVLNGAGHLRTYPHVHRLEAFFGAALERDSSA
jgi:16S rRNA (cytosine967-C5)-methyltransferase